MINDFIKRFGTAILNNTKYYYLFATNRSVCLSRYVPTNLSKFRARFSHGSSELRPRHVVENPRTISANRGRAFGLGSPKNVNNHPPSICSDFCLTFIDLNIQKYVQQ